jgi:hypothetical protein
MGKQSDFRLINYAMWAIHNFRYYGLARLTKMAGSPHPICKAIAQESPNHLLTRQQEMGGKFRLNPTDRAIWFEF